MKSQGFLCIIISIIVLELLEESVAISLWFGSDKVKLTDIQVVTVYAGRMTTGRRARVPQLKCTGGNAGCHTFVFETAQCYNRGTDGFDVQWECKTNMDSTYRFGKIEVYCEGYDYPEDPYVLKGSCGLEYTLDLSNGGPTHIIAYFVWGIMILITIYLMTKIIILNANFEDRTVETVITPSIKKKPVITPSQPVPETRIPVRISTQQWIENQMNSNPEQKPFIPAMPTLDFNNNNVIQNGFVKNVVQDANINERIQEPNIKIQAFNVRNPIQHTINRNPIPEVIIKTKTDANHFGSSNFPVSPPTTVINNYSPFQNDPSPKPANNNFIFVSNNANPVDNSRLNVTPRRSKSADFLDGIVAARMATNLFHLAKMAATPKPAAPAIKAIGTRVVSGFGGTKRR